MKVCKVCKKEFEAKGKQQYCSSECIKINKNNDRRKEVILFECLICKKEFNQKRKDNITCSSSCSQKLWVLNNPDKNHERNNGNDAKIRNKQWYDDNKDKIKKIRNRYKKKKYSIDPLFKLKENVRNLIRGSLSSIGKRKNTKTEQILGCSFIEFKQHIESLWEPWMNWSNKGNPKDGVYEPNKTWDIDHIIPSSNAETEDDVYKLNHYSNYQPLCTYYNRFIKRNLEM
jgi:hypothetical protein